MRSELAITGAQSDPEIISAMEVFGYDSTSLQEAQVQLEGVREFMVVVQQARAAQKVATQTVKLAFSMARVACSDLAILAREVFKADPAALATLGLSRGNQPQALADFLLYADKLFAGALTAPDAIKQRLATRGYGAARLASEKTKVDTLRRLNQAQEQAKGTAQDLTPQQAHLLNELDSWTMTYRKLARRALRHRPQLLEKLGISV